MVTLSNVHCPFSYPYYLPDRLQMLLCKCYFTNVTLQMLLYKCYFTIVDIQMLLLQNCKKIFLFQIVLLLHLRQGPEERLLLPAAHGLRARPEVHLRDLRKRLLIKVRTRQSQARSSWHSLLT